jgi:CopG family nickel-responsive transcriptional regulator
MGELVRTGISLEEGLLARFDEVIAAKGYQNRSEAVRDLIRDHLVSEEVESNKEVFGTLTIMYDHHQAGLSEKLIAAQHRAGSRVLATTHVHLDHHNCLEVLIMHGKSENVHELANSILTLRGVKHGKLVVTSVAAGHE